MLANTSTQHSRCSWSGRCGFRGVLALAALLLASASALATDPVLLVHNDSLSSYRPGVTTPVQGVAPQAWQRAAYLDGSVQSGSSLGMSLAAAPGNDLGWNAKGRGPGGLMLFDGTVTVQRVDLSLRAPGNSAWVIGRDYNGRQDHSGVYDSPGEQGNNWFQTSQPELITYTHSGGETAADDMVYIVTGARAYLSFKRTGTSSDVFRGVNGTAGIVYYVADGTDGDTYTYYDGIGNQWVFWGSNSPTGPAAGQLWKKTDPAGNVAYVGSTTKSTARAGSGGGSAGYNGSGQITDAFDGAGNEYAYTYTTGKLTKVEVKVGGVATGYKVEYTYYPSSVSYGLSGDLKTVTITTPMTDSGVNDVRTEYYRYYTSAYSNPSNPGDPHLLQMIVGAEGYRQADYADSTWDDDPLTMTTSDLKPFALAYFEYDSSRRVVSLFTNGECGCAGGGSNGSHSFTYATNAHFSGSGGYDTGWYSRTVELRPDGSYLVSYFDETGQALGVVVADGNPGAMSPPNFWPTQAVRDASGRLTEIDSVESVTTYYHADSGGNHAGDMTIAAGAGLVTTYIRWDNTGASGAAEGLVRDAEHQQGSGGTAYFDSYTQYTASTLTVGSYTYARVFPSIARRFPVEGTVENANNEDTGYSYSFWSSAAVLMPKVITITNPTVSTANNGSNSATVAYRYLRSDGTTAFTQSPGGIFDYSKYSGGLLVMSIHDVKTNDATDIDVGNDDPNGVFGVTETGDGMHRKTTYTYDGQGRLDTMTAPDGIISKQYYSVLADRRLVTMGFPKFTAGSPPTEYGPASYTVSNQAGKPEATATVAYSSGSTTTALTGLINESSASAKAAVSVGTVFRLSTSVYDSTGTKLSESRQYTDLSSFPGASGTNYLATTFIYDSSGRVIRALAADGTISRTDFDAIGRYASSDIGTDDTGNAGSPLSGTNNMVKTSEVVYDAGAVGNGHVTMRTAYIQDSTTGRRDTTTIYDYRGRAIVTEPPTAPYSVSAFNNMGQVTSTATYSSTSGLSASSVPTTSTNRLAKTDYDYDQLRRLFRTTIHSISSGTDADNLVSDEKTFDADGRLLRDVGPQITKYAYDHQGRLITAWVCGTINDSAYADASGVSGDKVVEERQTVYESESSDNVVMSAVIGRHYDESSSTTGALDSGADSNILKYTMANLSGRIQISASWFDFLHRPTTMASYGTNGGSDFDRKPGGSWLTAPTASSGSVLVTTTSYNDNGTVLNNVNINGRETRYTYDDAGRMTKQVDNYVNGVPGNDNDITTLMVYDTSGRLSDRVTDIDGSGTLNAGDYDTKYTYGVTKGTGAADSKIASNSLLYKVQYPDSAGGSDVVQYAYNALQQVKYMLDQAGTEHQYDYDDSGRKTQDRVTAFGSGISQTVKRCAWTYDTQGRVSLVSQYDNATVGSGSVLDEVKYTYDTWPGALVTLLEQDHNSAVSGGGDQTSVSYTYTKGTAGGMAIRPDTETLPDGSTVTFRYLTTNGVDDGLSRITRVKLASTDQSEYLYTGTSQLIRTDELVPAIYSTRGNGSSHDYSRLDQFNRVTTDKWHGGSGGLDFYDCSITYGTGANTAGTILRVQDNVLDGFDAVYSYDSMDRLIAQDEGRLSGTTIGTRTRIEEWKDDSGGGGSGSGVTALDQLGNWTYHRRDLDGGATPNFSGTGEFKSKNYFDQANQWVKVGGGANRNIEKSTGTSYTTANYTHAYDAAGNWTDDNVSYTMAYDAWNRLISVTDQSTKLLAEYSYNGLGWRTGWHDDTNGSGAADTSDPWYHVTYDTQWRPVAVARWAYNGGSGHYEPDTYVHERFLYHEARGGNPDTLIRRDTDANAWTSAAASTLTVAVYYCANWRGDTSVIVDGTPNIVERVKYSAYGVPFGLPAGDHDCDGDWDLTDKLAINAGTPYRACADVNLDGSMGAADVTAAKTFNTVGRGQLSRSTTANRHGYAAYEHDHNFTDTFCHVRYRVLNIDLGRWLTRDPIGYFYDRNLYSYIANAPVATNDPYGLKPPGSHSHGPGIGGFELPIELWDPDPIHGGGGSISYCTTMCAPINGVLSGCVSLCYGVSAGVCCCGAGECSAWSLRTYCVTGSIVITGSVRPGESTDFTPTISSGTCPTTRQDDGRCSWRDIEFCVSLSFGVGGWTAGCRACYKLGEDHLTVQCGLGIGQGTGASLSGCITCGGLVHGLSCMGDSR